MLTDWCEHHELLQGLVPFERYSYDPFEVGEQLREAFADAPETAATVLLDKDPGIWMSQNTFRFHVLVNGSWRVSNRRYVNPDYIHIEEYDSGITTDPERRDDEIRRAMQSGLMSKDDLAPRFGIDPESVADLCQQHELSWAETSRRGRRRLARTCQLALEWGYSLQEIADALPRSKDTLQNWISTHADFEDLPADPTAQGDGRE